MGEEKYIRNFGRKPEGGVDWRIKLILILGKWGGTYGLGSFGSK
jgi:hypothetical protein